MKVIAVMGDVVDEVMGDVVDEVDLF